MTDSPNIKSTVANLRVEYETAGLRKNDLHPDPVKQFERWLADALAAEILEPHAMTLATATKTGLSSARIVLLRGFDERGFVFYTNYHSNKGEDLAENPQAALTFYWAELHRQVRLSGPVSQISTSESDEYFAGRPRDSQIGAWASEQSRPISNRAELENKIRAVEEQYQDQPIPRPPYWGGYRLTPRRIEFWQGRPSRLHDRFCYTQQIDQQWRLERLSP